jgi:hypothetical protein
MGGSPILSSPSVPVSPAPREAEGDRARDLAFRLREITAAPGTLPRLAAANVTMLCAATAARILRAPRPWLGLLARSQGLVHVALVVAVLAPWLDQFEGALRRRGTL